MRFECNISVNFNDSTMIRIAINGFERIIRLIFRTLRELYSNQCTVVAIHDLTSIKSNVHLLQYDSSQGIFKEEIEIDEEEKSFHIGEEPNRLDIQVLDGKVYPSELPWKDLDVDFVLESTGVYRTKAKVDASGRMLTDGYDVHIFARARKVLLSFSAADDVQVTVVPGANEEDLINGATIVPIGSCTTNCLVPLVKVLYDNFKFKNGFMTTIHSYINDQRMADNKHPDLRKARSAGINIIPSSINAALAVSIVVKKLFPHSLDGMSLLVSTIAGAMVDLPVNIEDEVTTEQVNQPFETVSGAAPLKGIIRYETDSIVSTDIIHESASSIFDSALTKVILNIKRRHSCEGILLV